MTVGSPSASRALPASLFEADYVELFQAFRIANALWVLRWYAVTGYTGGVDRAVASITRYLVEIGAG